MDFSECAEHICELIDQAGKRVMSIERAKILAISIIAEYSESQHKQTMEMLNRWRERSERRTETFR